MTSYFSLFWVVKLQEMQLSWTHNQVCTCRETQGAVTEGSPRGLFNRGLKESAPPEVGFNRAQWRLLSQAPRYPMAYCPWNILVKLEATNLKTNTLHIIVLLHGEKGITPNYEITWGQVHPPRMGGGGAAGGSLTPGQSFVQLLVTSEPRAQSASTRREKLPRIPVIICDTNIIPRAKSLGVIFFIQYFYMKVISFF